MDIDKQINQILSDIYQKKTGNVLNEDLFKFTHKSLDNAINKGTLNLEVNAENIAFIGKLKTSAGVFSAFKNHHQTQAIVDLLTDKDGKLVPFSKFKKEALLISNKYNKNWLKTEYNTAVRRATTGANFQKFRATADVYPNLKWTSSRAETPREVHKKYYGLILPIEDSFWVENFPGDEWNCKCGLARTKAAAGKRPTSLTKSPKGLDGNPAFTGETFSGSHPMFKGLSKKETSELKAEHEKLKTKIPYGDVNYTSKNGSSVNVHPYADVNDLEVNFYSAKLIVDQLEKTKIKIAPHVEIQNVKNPEFIINGKISDLKRQDGNQVYSNINSAIKQGCEVIVYKLGDVPKIQTAQRLYERVNGSLMKREKHPIKKLIIIDKDEVVHTFKIKAKK